jgi:hypothetical protein
VLNRSCSNNTKEQRNFIVVELDSCSECDYTGGANVDGSNCDNDYQQQGDLDWETNLTVDTVSELSGDELEDNLCMLWNEKSIADAEKLGKPAVFEKLATAASSREWEKANVAARTRTEARAVTKMQKKHKSHRCRE